MDISLEFIDAQDELRCVVKADPRCFSLVGIKTFVDRFMQLIDRLVALPERPFNMESVAATQDYNVVPGPLNRHPQDTVAAVSLIDWIDRQTARHPSLIALREQDQTLDYQTLQSTAGTPPNF